MHEIIYREAITVYKQKDSRKVRFFNGFLGSCSLRSGNLGTYQAALREAGFGGAFTFQGLSFDWRTVQLYPSGVFKSCTLLEKPENSSFKTEPGMIALKPETGGASYVEFSERGLLKSVTAFPGTELKLNSLCSYKPTAGAFHGSDMLEFDENERLRSINFYRTDTVYFCVPNGNETRIFPLLVSAGEAKLLISENGIPLTSVLQDYKRTNLDSLLDGFSVTLNSGIKVNAAWDTPIEFYPSGTIKRMTLAVAAEVPKNGGGVCNIPAKTEFELDENEKAICP